MNISTGGPHLLLFERDQQLASLLISELQLAGYECHTARTAVEVFDAIARFPIRLVLVNLAQAAAARREFWVALDTQRRGRGVQVFTFHCVNIAGYGAQDPDERSQTTIADMEVDGMMGLMNLVDAVRTRIPGPGSSTATNTMPRLSKISATPPPPSPRPAPPTTNSTIYRSTSSLDTQSYQPSAFSSIQPTANLSPSMPPAPQQQPAAFTTPTTDAGEAGSGGQGSYTDRIRAVLYPNQKSWSSSTGLTPPPEVRIEPEPPRPSQSVGRTASMSGTAALQRLASGQSNLEGARESGLAQLSRLLQDYRTPTIEDTSAAAPPLQEPAPPMYPTTSRLSSPTTSSLTGSLPMPPSQPMSQATSGMSSTLYSPQVPPSAPAPMPINNVEVRLSRQDDRSIGTQPLRAAPIQDLMENRNTVGLAGSEPYARQNSAQAPAAPAPVPQLSSIAPTPVSTPVPPPSYAPAPTVIPVSASTVTAVPNRENALPPSPLTAVPNRETAAPPQIEVVEDKKQPAVAEVVNAEQYADNKLQSDSYVDEELSPAITMHGTAPNFPIEMPDTVAAFPFPSEALAATASDELRNAPNSATLIDIMESFPPMPPPKSQPPQPTVLNGRATRSLGSVLLAGHLVPENRLEVAQHIQRMLSGVDMNYQLGEILLMFKLLTPDQLLAASLVSYGLITTQQISALGRIRQELHAIGLEYDLENLLILFRILTPEQIREAKSNRQS